MPPIDDELRSALTGRAELLTPAADPFAGIERKAKSIKRNRGFAAIVGTAAAVALVAVAVPAVIGGSTTTTSPQDFATQSPTTITGRPANAVSWAGTTSVTARSEDPVGAAVRAWADSRRVAYSAVRGEELGAPVITTDRSATAVFLQLWVPGGKAAFVIAQSEPGLATVIARSGDAVPDALVVEAAIAGKQSPDIAAVTAPGVMRLEYDGGDGTGFAEVELDGRTTSFSRGRLTAGRDRVRAVGTGREDAHDVWVQGRAEGQDPGASDGEPSNLVTWPMKGALGSGPFLVDAKKAFALGLGGKVDDLVFRPLLALDTDGGLRYVAGQAWLKGGKAHGVAYATGGECGAEPFIGRETPAAAKVLAFSPGCVPGRTTDTVFVVPAPGTGQVSYGAEASEYRPVSFLPGLEPVAELDRAPLASRGDDQLQVLDGNGDPDKPLYEGSLQELLCGVKECG